MPPEGELNRKPNKQCALKCVGGMYGQLETFGGQKSGNEKGKNYMGVGTTPLPWLYRRVNVMVSYNVSRMINIIDRYSLFSEKNMIRYQ